MSRPAVGLTVLALVLWTMLPSLAQPWIDPDFFWHVRLGRTMLDGGAVVAPDEVSYATMKGAYRRHSWGAEVLMASLDERAGVDGYRTARMLLRGLLIGLVAAACLRAGRSRTFSLLCASCILPISLLGCELRPIMIAYVLLAALAWLHVAPRAPPPGAPRPTPGPLVFAATFVLMAALTNVHPISVVALCWVGACWVGAWMEARRVRRRARAAAAEGTRAAGADEASIAAARARADYYMILTGASFLALAVDPRPFGAIESLLLVRTDPIAAGRWVQEMLPPQMVGLLGWSGIAIGITAVAACARSRRTRPHEWFLLLGSLYLGLEFVRNLVTLEIVALPLLARHGPALLRPLLARLRLLGRRAALRRLRPVRGVLTTLLAALLVAYVVLTSLRDLRRSAPLSSDPTTAQDAATFPAHAASWVQANIPRLDRPRRIIVPYDWGGYLAYRLGPGYLVSQYPQAQLFSPAYWEDFINYRPEAVRARLLDGSPDAALLAHGDRLWMHILVKDEGWREAYRDERAVVLFPPAR